MARGVKGTGFIYPRRAKASPDAPNGPRYGGILPSCKKEAQKFPYKPKCEPYQPFIPDSECLAWDKLRYAIRFPNPVNFRWALLEVKDFLGCDYSDMAHNCSVHRYTLRQWLVGNSWPRQECNRAIILESFLWCVDPNVVYVLKSAAEEEEKKVDPGVLAFREYARKMLTEGPGEEDE